MDDEFYTIEEVARLLKVSEGAIRKWIAQGKLKGVKLGRIWRIRKGDLEAFIDNLEV
jgi:excisionase family DNA binding protein